MIASLLSLYRTLLFITLKSFLVYSQVIFLTVSFVFLLIFPPVCELVCPDGMNLDRRTCQCSACNNTCENGELNGDTCECSCDPNWTGSNCSVCSVSCVNGGTRDDAQCSCSCDQLWTGDTCSECSLTCANGGTKNDAECTCDCSPPWSGDTCSDCSLTCANGGTRNDEECICVCDPPWSGDSCSGNFKMGTNCFLTTVIWVLVRHNCHKSEFPCVWFFHIPLGPTSADYIFKNNLWLKDFTIN